MFTQRRGLLRILRMFLTVTVTLGCGRQVQILLIGLLVVLNVGNCRLMGIGILELQQFK